jgi:hypothetical protein
MLPTCSFYVEDTVHVCFNNSSGGRWCGDVVGRQGNKCTHVCNSTHANSHGEVTDRRPFKKNASCTPAKIVSCRNTAAATPAASGLLFATTSINHTEWINVYKPPAPLNKREILSHTTKTQAVYGFTSMPLIHSMLKAAFLDQTPSPFAIGTRKYLWKYSLGYGDIRNCKLKHWILWKNTYSNYFTLAYTAT